MHTDIDFTNPPRRRTGALAIIRNESGAVLMVQKSYKGGSFGLPGGCANEDEPPHRAFTREVQEETGLTLAPGRLLVVHYMSRNPETGATEGLNLVWDGGTVSSESQIILPAPAPGEEPELTSYRFVPLDEVHELAASYTALRINAAVGVLSASHLPTAYLVDG
ncbi:NUDIX domain-containing protein [Streptomyces sp. NPDC101776]|uniref:NUDIX domain-containing protein n=1 Tax=Streptomyces sp. NPDC101776 TaxID=3366146 RepID=UPI00380F4048